jgi:hypothetical protein
MFVFVDIRHLLLKVSAQVQLNSLLRRSGIVCVHARLSELVPGAQLIFRHWPKIADGCQILCVRRPPDDQATEDCGEHKALTA